MNQYRMFFAETSTWPPKMHQKLTKHGRFCKQKNQLPTKSHDELEDNSNMDGLFVTNYLALVASPGVCVVESWVVGSWTRWLLGWVCIVYIESLFALEKVSMFEGSIWQCKGCIVMYAGFSNACAKNVNDLLSLFPMLGVGDWYCIVWVSVCICTLLILGIWQIVFGCFLVGWGSLGWEGMVVVKWVCFYKAIGP